ncbi:MAG: hypothetical protein IPO26_21720 [Saprospiraceae bacterium]|nr:hypothetical protein [Saprospiraceae bacterium]
MDASNLHQYNGLYKDSLSVIGNYIDPTLTPRSHWIHPELDRLSTDTKLKSQYSLMSIEASNGDIIKSQLHFCTISRWCRMDRKS